MRSTTGIVLAALATSLIAAPAIAVSCGDVITDAQAMTGDLICSTEPGVTIDEGGSLDMGGFTLSCNGTQQGVKIDGKGGKLSNGVVTGCADSSVSTSGEKHKIDHVLVSASGVGFVISSLGTKISNCAALNNSSDGLRAEAPGASITRFIAKGNGGDGIEAVSGGYKISDVSVFGDGSSRGIALSGDGSKVSKVRIFHASTGISVAGSFNKISDATALKYTGTGFFLTGQSNKVKKSVATGGSGALAGFVLNGGGASSISGCRSTGGIVGIESYDGSGNIISKNQVFGGGNWGIWVRGASNIITGNRAVGSGIVDLHEVTAGCTNGDVWEKNIGSRNDTCIE